MPASREDFATGMRRSNDVALVRPIRIYWQRRDVNTRSGHAAYRVCPDPFHSRNRPPSGPKPAEAFTTVNLHETAEKLSDRRKARAQRHRKQQDKTRR